MGRIFMHRVGHRFAVLASRAALALACCTLFTASNALALDYPTKQVHVLVGYPPGGSTDILARLFGNWLSERLKQTFIVENRAGAGNNLATEAVAKAAPDGYTILLVNPANGINATLYKKLPFNFLRDIAPVAGLAELPFVIDVSPSLPVKTVAEFIAYAKANPGTINMATTGIGTSVHLAGELLQAMAGIKVQNVPYRGEAPAMNDLIAGQAHAIFGSPAATLPHVNSGALRAIAVSSAVRMNALPNVPTVGDTVPGYEASTFYGVAAPKGTPAEVIDKLNREINAGLVSPTINARITDLGSAVLSLSAADFGKLIAEETEKWAKVIKTANIKPEP